MKSNVMVLISVGLLLLWSCETPTADDQENTEALTDTLTEHSAIIQFQPPENGYLAEGFYKRFEGTVGNLPVVMHLVKSSRYEGIQERPQEQVSGFYYYEKYQQPITLSQLFVGGEEKTAGEDKTVLSEGNNTEEQHYWTGTFAPEGRFAGTWENADTGLKLPFELTEVYPEGAVKFLEYHAGQFKEFNPADPDGPKAACNFSLLHPTNPDTDLGLGIIWNIMPHITNDSVTELGLHPFEALLGEVAGFMKELDNQVGEWGPDNMDHFNSLTQYVEVVWNNNHRVGLRFFDYSYTGGAHGNWGSSFINIDLKKGGELIRLEDIFKPGFEAELKYRLKLAARKIYGVNQNQIMTAPFHEDNLEATENFLMTEKGILFNYVPYEVGVYALGEVRLFIAYEELQDFMN